MNLFKKKCAYCNKKIERGSEVLVKVKVPEFINEVNKTFCSEEHAALYKKYVKGTPSRNSCPYCKT